MFLRILFFSLFTFWLNSSELQLSLSASPSRINPLLATDSASSEIADYIFNGLVKFDKNGTIVGDLAKSFTFEDNTTLIFELREGIKWHNGQPFDADDVIFTYNLLSNPKLVTPYKDDFKYIKNIEKISDLKVRIKYTQPYFKALSIWMMGLLPKHLWEDVEDPMTSPFNKAPIGTGPYKLTKPFGVNEKIVLESNKEYFYHAPKIEKINFHYLPDSSTQFLALKAKEIDMSSLEPLQVQRQLDKKFLDSFRLIEQPSNSYTYLGFNLRKKPFNNKMVRKAINLAIDKQEIIDLLFFSHGLVCEGPFMPKSPQYPTDFNPTIHNPQKAKKILAKLGYTQSHPLQFELITNADNDTRVYTAQIIQNQLERVGIKMSIRTMEWQAFLNTIVMPHQFEAVLLGWSLSLTPDAYSIWHSDGDKQGGFNFIGYHNSEVDRLITESQSMIDSDKFALNYQKLFKMIVEDYPYVFLYIPNSITAANRQIQGIEPSITGILHNQIEWSKE